MLEIRQSNAFTRDFKKIKKQGKNFDLLDEVVGLLEESAQLPKFYRNHKLTGDYKSYFELHVEPDWLLIYKIDATTLVLTRTGSHSELFA